MTLPGEDFLDQWKGYIRKIDHGQYLEQHALHPRNSDPVKTRIQLDIDSRECVEYPKELISMCNKR